MQLLHRVQQAGGEVHGQRSGHHLVTQLLVQVHCVLEGAESRGGGGGNKHLEKINGFAQNALKRIESTVGVGEIIDSSMHDSL